MGFLINIMLKQKTYFSQDIGQSAIFSTGFPIRFFLPHLVEYHEQNLSYTKRK